MTLIVRGSFGFDAGWAKLLTDNNAAEATPATTPYHVVFAELMGPFLAGSAFLAAQGEPRGSAAQDPSHAAGRPLAARSEPRSWPCDPFFTRLAERIARNAARPALSRGHRGRIDQGDVREGLRELPSRPLRSLVELLRPAGQHRCANPKNRSNRRAPHRPAAHAHTHLLTRSCMPGTRPPRWKSVRALRIVAKHEASRTGRADRVDRPPDARIVRVAESRSSAGAAGWHRDLGAVGLTKLPALSNPRCRRLCESWRTSRHR